MRIGRAGHPPTVLVCEEPEALLDAIQEARSRAGAKVRVADVPEELEHEVPAAAGEAKKDLTAG